jgi:hypothetical protein
VDLPDQQRRNFETALVASTTAKYIRSHRADTDTTLAIVGVVQSTYFRKDGGCLSLEFRLRVRIDFAVQTDFLELRRCPFHDFPPCIAVARRLLTNTALPWDGSLAPASATLAALPVQAENVKAPPARIDAIWTGTTRGLLRSDVDVPVGDRRDRTFCRGIYCVSGAGVAGIQFLHR